jgi:hypothetical protein
VRGKGTKLSEGERDLEGQRAFLSLSGLFQDYYIFGNILFGVVTPIPIREDHIRVYFVRDFYVAPKG